MPISIVPAPVVTELQRQFNYEFAAAHAYQALSLWCAAHNFNGFAEFFSKQTSEEREHAEKLYKHLLDRGVTPVLTAVPAPKQEFANLAQVAAHALQMEQANTKGINAVYEAAVAAKDYPAQILMQWFISEQVEEEAWCAKFPHGRPPLTSPAPLADPARHIIKYLE